MTNIVRDEREALSKATPITIGLMCSLLILTATGGWYASAMYYEIQNVKGQANANTTVLKSVLELTEKMDRRIEWIEKTQAKP